MELNQLLKYLYKNICIMEIRILIYVECFIEKGVLKVHEL